MARRRSRAANKPFGLVVRTAWKAIWLSAAFLLVLLIVFAGVRPPPGIYMMSEGVRLGGFEQDWVPLEEITPAMARSVVAAEDAKFCEHWGVDWDELAEVIEDGATRGASTITQQVAKNVFLWHGRSYVRKAMELPLAMLIESMWTKRRIIEVYLNVIELDEGIFGVEAGAQHYFGVSAADLSDLQAARLASILPDPKDRSASRPGPFTVKKAKRVMDGAATIKQDGRAECFE
ncbi:MAG: monofunctional biosynthetic peptidoglycan transglycosylase [Pseudomonadota bacterium]